MRLVTIFTTLIYCFSVVRKTGFYVTLIRGSFATLNTSARVFIAQPYLS